MRHWIAIIWCLAGLFVQGATPWDEGKYGLSFYAYEKNKDERTALIIPHDQNSLSFDNYLSVGFDLKIRSETEHFGYVCRIILGGETSVDLLLNNPFDGIPGLCLIGGNRHLGNIDSTGEKWDLEQWNHLLLEMKAEGDQLIVTVNGRDTGKPLKLPQLRKAKIYFGMVDLAGFSTTDVAPFVLRNLTIGTNPDQPSLYWPLDRPDRTGIVTPVHGRISASVSHPYWQIYDHIRWKKIARLNFNSKTFPVPAHNEEAIFFVSGESVLRFDLQTYQQTRYSFSPRLPVENMANQFICDPSTGDLLLYDFEGALPEYISRFDPQNESWSAPLLKKIESGYQHHNSFFSPADSCLVQLFGYGYHRYHAVMNRLSVRGDLTTDSLTEIIPPRYLSAIGVTDTLIYIYGGMGNGKGPQEYGTQIFNDLYVMNTKDYSVRKCWDRPLKAFPEVAASRLVFSSEKDKAYALFFDPGRFVSRLQLGEINLNEGEITLMADTIPFIFHDVHSDATLLCDKQQQRLFAATIHQTTDHSYEGNLYSIDLPILETLPAPESDSHKIWIGIVIGIVLAGGIGLAIRIRQRGRKNTQSSSEKRHPATEPQTIPPALEEKLFGEVGTAQPLSPGIHLLGGFQVIDQQGRDISGEFTPMMKRLLSLIILYTATDGKGISNTQLREILWPDKSEESTQNNRSVNIRKIRLLLEGVGHFEIASDNGYWMILLHEQAYCDYLYASQYLEEIRNGKSDNISFPLLELVAKGQLLPDLSYDWLDSFKAAYTDAIITLFTHWREYVVAKSDYRMQILLSERILKFDSLDEESVRAKCRALVALKRIGAAKSTFDNFVREYLQIMGENYPTGFESFVH